MKKVSIFGVGSMGARVAFFLARSRDISRIRLVDIDPDRSRATLLDFLQSNIALQSKIAFVDYEEPKEIHQSDVVIVAAGVEAPIDTKPSMPTSRDIERMEQIAAHIAHFTPQSTVAVLSQPAELFCRIIAKSGEFRPESVIGFPLLIYREWFREYIGHLVGLSHEDVRISTVRTLDGEELVPEQCSVGGVPLTSLVEERDKLYALPGPEVMKKRLEHHHYGPAAVISEVTGEIVSKRRQPITTIAIHKDVDAYIESKSVVGPDGVERHIPLSLTAEQERRHQEYRETVVELTRQLA